MDRDKIICRQCRREVLRKAGKCPNCGVESPAKWSLNPQPSPKPDDARNSTVAGSCLLILFVAMGGLVFWGFKSCTGASERSAQQSEQTRLPSKENSASDGRADGVTVPPHEVVSNTSLAPKQGRRIEIHSTDPKLTRDECRALIERYRDQGGPDGQVSVHKPSSLLKGHLAPWCLENFEGKGIEFNNSLFER